MGPQLKLKWGLQGGCELVMKDRLLACSCDRLPWVGTDLVMCGRFTSSALTDRQQAGGVPSLCVG